MPGGGSKQTTTSNATTSVGPWQPSQGLLQNILGQAGGINTSVTPGQQEGINSLINAGISAGSYQPNLTGLTNKLFAGGNYGQGTSGIQAAQGTAANTLGGIASAPLDPMQNPATAGVLNSIKDQVYNSVGDQFAAANRGSPADSGYGTRALATGYTNAIAPFLLNQYNTNVANASNAANSLTNNAIGASNAYNQTAAGQLGAELQAPQSLQNFGIPGAMQLEAGGLPLQTQLSNIGALSNLILPIAALGKQGTENSTSVQQQKSDPLQAAIGGLLGLGGLGVSATGTGGILSGWNPFGWRSTGGSGGSGG